MTAKVWLLTDAGGPRRHMSGYGYVMDAVEEGKTVQRVYGWQQGTVNRYEALLSAAEAASGRIRKGADLSEVDYLTDDRLFCENFNRLLTEWIPAGWKRSQGRLIKGVNKWRSIVGFRHAETIHPALVSHLEIKRYVTVMQEMQKKEDLE